MGYTRLLHLQTIALININLQSGVLLAEYWNARGATYTHRHHSAIVESTSYGEISLSRYSGPVGNESIGVLGRLSHAEHPGALVGLHRLDFALSMMGDDSALFDFDSSVNPLPAAIVAADDQYKSWFKYVDAMGERGIKRMVFRRSQIGYCQDWVFGMLEVQLQKESCRTP